ncbi:MAG TPA: hypothetical protein VFP22_06110, partial [Candidatus Limnocylindrales bacterium]|nr:hypothetical protein [Candidatus Limnocylindrales bacterium]
ADGTISVSSTGARRVAALPEIAAAEIDLARTALARLGGPPPATAALATPATTPTARTEPLIARRLAFSCGIPSSG